MNFSSQYLETPDVEASSEDYASRFSGAVGAWFLKVQEHATLRMLSPYPGATVLDVGGGHGQLTGALVANGYHVTVLGSADVCKTRISKLVDEGRCRFQVGDILALPYEDQAFETVIGFRMLPHVTRWGEVLSELARVAEKVVLIDYPAARSFNWFAPRFFRIKKTLEGNTRPFTCFRETDLLEIVQKLGFACVDRYAEFFFPMILHRTISWQSLSSGAEALCRALGLTSWLGSPVILKLLRERTTP